MHMYMFQSFARVVDLQRLKNVKVDPMSVKVWAPLVYSNGEEDSRGSIT